MGVSLFIYGKEAFFFNLLCVLIWKRMLFFVSLLLFFSLIPVFCFCFVSFSLCFSFLFFSLFFPPPPPPPPFSVLLFLCCYLLFLGEKISHSLSPRFHSVFAVAAVVFAPAAAAALIVIVLVAN